MLAGVAEAGLFTRMSHRPYWASNRLVAEADAHSAGRLATRHLSGLEGWLGPPGVPVVSLAEGEEFVLDGQKMWLTNGARAGVVATLAKDGLDGGSAYKNMTTFLIEKQPGFGETRPGLTIPGQIDKMGYKGVETTEMVLDGVRVACRRGPRRPERPRPGLSRRAWPSCWRRSTARK